MLTSLKTKLKKLKTQTEKKSRNRKNIRFTYNTMHLTKQNTELRLIECECFKQQSKNYCKKPILNKTSHSKL